MAVGGDAGVIAAGDFIQQSLESFVRSEKVADHRSGVLPFDAIPLAFSQRPQPENHAISQQSLESFVQVPKGGVTYRDPFGGRGQVPNDPEWPVIDCTAQSHKRPVGNLSWILMPILAHAAGQPSRQWKSIAASGCQDLLNAALEAANSISVPSDVCWCGDKTESTMPDSSFEEVALPYLSTAKVSRFVEIISPYDGWKSVLQAARQHRFDAHIVTSQDSNLEITQLSAVEGLRSEVVSVNDLDKAEIAPHNSIFGPPILPSPITPPTGPVAVQDFCCPECNFAPSHPSAKEWKMAEHLNAMHFGSLAAIDLSSIGCYLCDTCHMAVSKTSRAATHSKVCGTVFKTKWQRLYAGKDAKREKARSFSREVVASKPQQNNAVVEAMESIRQGTVVDWCSERPSTHRSLHRNQWKEWAELIYNDILKGYNRSSQLEKKEKWNHFIDAPRTFLSKPNPSKEDKKEEEPRTTNAASPPRQPQRQSDEGDPEGALERRIRELIRLNAPGKAARYLKNSDSTILPPTPETIKELRDLSFKDPQPLSQSELESMSKLLKPVFMLNQELVHRVVRKVMSKGSAPGIDGWTRELLVPICESAPALWEFTAMLLDVAHGAIDPEVADKLAATSIFGVKRPDKPAARPICPESHIFKLACLCVFQTVKPRIVHLLAPFQVGVGGNVEKLVHELRSIYESSECLAVADGASAYLKMSRGHMLRELFSYNELAPMRGVAFLCLGKPSRTCVYKGSTCIEAWQMTNGINEGRVLGPILFSLGLLSVLKQAAVKFPAVKIRAYLDDTHVGGSEADALGAFSVIKDEGQKIGYTLTKCRILRALPRTAQLPETSTSAMFTTVVGTAAKVLGSFIGNAQASEAILNRCKVGGENFFNKLQSLPLRKHTKYTLLRVCGIPIFNFLMRTNRPTDAGAAARWIDEHIWEVAESIIESQLPSFQRDIIQLPISRGGLGMRTYGPLLQILYESSQDVKGIQKQRLTERDRDKSAVLYNSLACETDRRIFISNMSAGRYLTDPQISLVDPAFLCATRQRIFMQVLPQSTLCVCGQPATNDHVNRCIHLPGVPRRTRHDAVVQAISSVAMAYAVSNTVEPQHTQENNRERPDIIFPYPVQASVDVSITYCGRNTHSEVVTPGALRLTEKTDSWRAFCAARGLRNTPLVWESNGKMEAATIRFFKQLAEPHTSPLTIARPCDAYIAEALRALLDSSTEMFTAALNSNVIKQRTRHGNN